MFRQYSECYQNCFGPPLLLSGPQEPPPKSSFIVKPPMCFLYIVKYTTYRLKILKMASDSFFLFVFSINFCVCRLVDNLDEIGQQGDQN
jgi:hypothetical protein